MATIEDGYNLALVPRGKGSFRLVMPDESTGALDFAQFKGIDGAYAVKWPVNPWSTGARGIVDMLNRIDFVREKGFVEGGY